ncbi:hypothetical protein [Paremcibacter congregatus]|uniref:hypothetical protein n=1 Tax=Paremcibacter congregatus TaxID=2043170 RepID=UPI0030EF4420|tara:strand:+ start:4632 stop:4796 length:165 start_codon:yes stop_codon:yes gene_type:complete
MTEHWYATGYKTSQRAHEVLENEISENQLDIRNVSVKPYITVNGKRRYGIVESF